jgi:hypothetical protein
MDAGAQAGPVSRDDIVLMMEAGTLGRATLVWAPGMEGWRQAADVLGGSYGSTAAIGTAQPGQYRAARTPEERLAARATWSLVWGLVSIYRSFRAMGVSRSRSRIHPCRLRRRRPSRNVLSCIGPLEEAGLGTPFDLWRHGALWTCSAWRRCRGNAWQ